MGQVALQQVHQQLAVGFRGERPTVAGAAQRRQRGVDAEAQSLTEEEVEYLVGARGRVSGERTDAAHVQAVGASALDARHSGAEIAWATLGVVDVLGAVEAGAQGNVVLAK
jgi:hypothetical protein